MESLESICVLVLSRLAVLLFGNRVIGQIKKMLERVEKAHGYIFLIH